MYIERERERKGESERERGREREREGRREKGDNLKENQLWSEALSKWENNSSFSIWAPAMIRLWLFGDKKELHGCCLLGTNKQLKLNVVLLQNHKKIPQCDDTCDNQENSVGHASIHMKTSNAWRRWPGGTSGNRIWRESTSCRFSFMHVQCVSIRTPQILFIQPAVRHGHWNKHQGERFKMKEH